MISIHTWAQLQAVIQKEPLLVIYLSSADCGVCKADEPRVRELCEKYQLPEVSFDVKDIPEAAGQLNVFSLPAAVLMYQGKEMHRQARIIDFRELEKRIQEFTDAMNG